MSLTEDLAIEAVGNGEEYIPVDDVIANYPEGVTVNGCHAFKFKNGNKTYVKVKILRREKK